MDSGSYQLESPTIRTEHVTVPSEDGANQKKIIIGLIVAVVVILVILIGGVIILAQPTTDTARIRDIFIIFMAIESLLLGLTLVILIVQMARLINLLQNEIKPILDSLNETTSNLRGTSSFLSDNLVEPVIKMNEYVAGLSEFFKLVGLARGRPKR